VKTSDWTADEARISVFACQICNLCYETEDDVKKLADIAKSEMDVEYALEDLRVWKSGPNRALTMTVKVDCKLPGFTDTNTPVLIDVVAFRGTSSGAEALQDIEAALMTDFTLKRDNSSIGTVADGFYDAFTNFRDKTTLFDYIIQSTAKHSHKLLITGNLT